MARALLAGCGCRGRALGRRLLDDGWQVRGTSRDPRKLAAIEGVGVGAALADPGRPASILDQIGDVTVLCWLLGSARGEPEAIAAIHGPALERVLEELVDTPVRGFVYEADGRVPGDHLERGAAVVRRAGERWRIPVEILDEDPADWGRWTEAALDSVRRLAS